MTETRIVSTTYDENGNIVEQITREISDAELVLEQVEKETKEANDQALVNYLNFINLDEQERRQLLKMLLGDFINRNRENYS